jgi:hypothetical protein
MTEYEGHRVGVEYEAGTALTAYAETIDVDPSKLGELAGPIAEVAAYTQRCSDFENVDPSDLLFGAGSDGFELTIRHAVGADWRRSFAVTDWALDQLITDRLKAPSRLREFGRSDGENYRRALANFANEVVQAKSDEGRRYLVRVVDLPGTGPTVRAFVSDKYQKLDNFQILGPTIKALETRLADDTVQVDTFGVDDTHFHLGVTLRDVSGATTTGAPTGHVPGTYLQPGSGLERGDEFFGGFWFRNSEVGAGATELAPRIFRVVCNNGLIVEDLAWRRPHRKLTGYWGSGIKGNIDWVIEKEIREGIVRSIESFPALIEAFGEAANEAEVEPIARLRTIGKVSGLTQTQTDHLIFGLAEEAEGRDTRAGVVNAITRTAQKESEVGDRRKLEALGGYVLRLPEPEYVRLYNPAKLEEEAV